MAEIVITAVGLVLFGVGARLAVRLHRAEHRAKGDPEWAEAGAAVLATCAVLGTVAVVGVALVR